MEIPKMLIWTPSLIPPFGGFRGTPFEVAMMPETVATEAIASQSSHPNSRGFEHVIIDPHTPIHRSQGSLLSQTTNFQCSPIWGEHRYPTYR